jgi:hypothetical protein
METCMHCAAPLAPENRFCPACGAARAGEVTVDADLAATMPLRTSPRPAMSAPGPAVSADGSRFVPGDVVRDRYRIVGLLGRGGMGEVYRADDLKLGQQVALKFLPPGLERDPSRLQRFLGEVRTARQVTHANVCRVFDIEEDGDGHFLTMEYVDGEDLASSLRRFGRLPEERAVTVARQICAGLSAAHDQGILHRDLKPANVMIDGRGRVKLTDFGLAALADSIGRDDVVAGTPAYMAPEQISGREVSLRSDIYALGVVLYELFTGQPPFRAESVADFRRLHVDSTPSQPTLHLPGLDPVIERAIMRCLEKNPADRPASALAVAAALPGGDPLQAALAAGETPSPELVAEAGRREGMAPGRAILLALAAILLLGGATHWAGRLSSLNFVPLEKRPEVLVDRAREIIGRVGYQEEVYAGPIDQAWGHLVWADVLSAVAAADSGSARWERLRQRPDAMGFWFRQSPDVLRPEPLSGPILVPGQVTLTNPMAATPGEVLVVLDLNGRLRRFEVMPKRFSTRAPREPDWTPLFTLAELDTARFTEDQPRYQRFMAPDVRRAWVGTRQDQPDVEIRVEAGAFEGRPILFNVATDASMKTLDEDPSPVRLGAGGWVLTSLQPLLILAVVIFAVRSSGRNINQGRSDRRGAVRFGAAVFVLSLLGRGLGSHTLFTRMAAEAVWPIFVGATFMSVAAWSLYSAAEPLGRRIWPTMFISSSRLLSRPAVQWRDPLIGQSILIGMLAAGLDFLVCGPLAWTLTSLVDGRPPFPMGVDLALLQGQRHALALILDQSLMIVFMFVHIMALVVSRFLLKKRIPTIALTLTIWTLFASPGSASEIGLALLSSGIFLFVLLRWGVVAMVAGRVVLGLAWKIRPADFTSWYCWGSVLVLVALALLAAYGAWAAVGNRTGRRFAAD